MSIKRQVILFVAMTIVSCNKSDIVPPCCELEVFPKFSTANRPIVLSVLNSMDSDSYSIRLKVRWDWETDGYWDTDYSSQLEISYQFSKVGWNIITAEITDEDGLTSSDSDSIFLFPIPEEGVFYDDRDGNLYKIVKIFNRWWFAENLRFGYCLNSEFTPSDNDSVEFFTYNNDMNNLIRYGGLYTFEEALGDTTQNSNHQGICPQGWSIPTLYDWSSITYNAPNLFLRSYYGPKGNSKLELDYGGFYSWEIITKTKIQQQGFFGLGAGGYFWTSTTKTIEQDSIEPPFNIKIRYAITIQPVDKLDDKLLFLSYRNFFARWVNDQINEDGSISYFKIAASVRCIKNE